MIIDINNTENKYGIIYTDPPWQQKRGDSKRIHHPNAGGVFDYQTISLSDIIDIHYTVFDNLTTEKHNIFIWTIDKYLRETEEFMENKFGYKRHARIIWDKCNGIPTAFTLRFSHEYLLWYYKPGKMLMPCKETRGKFMDVIREQSTIHSKKPKAAYELLEAMFPNIPKLEMFARNEREGWDCWGNELKEDD